MHTLSIAVTKAAFSYVKDIDGWKLTPAEEGLEMAAAVAAMPEEMEIWRSRAGGRPVLDGHGPVSEIKRAAEEYALSLLPTFTRTLAVHVGEAPLYFATPGHHSGAFFKKTAAGRAFVDFLGPQIFKADLSDSDDAIGDTSMHDGPGGAAEQLAAEVYHADRTYFVLAGTSGSNRIAMNALLAPGDLVLFDRNNHKSMYQALAQCGATPVYLDVVRNGAGVIGGLSAGAYDVDHLRALARAVSPKRGETPRPFRLACIQLVTYDGIFANAKEILRTMGQFCDYILFDSAWGGYESFISFMKDQSPLTLPLGPEDPGILVTQSVHKQLAGFSQTSQIQRKDAHLRGESRRVLDDVFQTAFAQHISTSPFFPLFAGLEMNAAIHKEKGEALWAEAMQFSVSLRKEIHARCRHMRPFQPDRVHGKPWEAADTETMLHDRAYWEVVPKAEWHGFSHLRKGQYLLDPCKVLVMTDGVDPVSGTYAARGIPAPLLALYLQSERIIPEKTDLYTILFLAEPGDGEEKRNRLVDALCRFEKLYEINAPISEVLPDLWKEAPDFYGKLGLYDLCQAQHDFLRAHQAGAIQRACFDTGHFPKAAMTVREAQEDFVRGKGQLVPLCEAAGRIALSSAAAYPPGICTVAAGEIWNETAISWFQLLLDFANAFPGFGVDLHGVKVERGDNGKLAGFVWVKRGV